MKVVAIVSFTALVFAAGAHAKCDQGAKTLFSCTTTKGKQIEVCDAGRKIQYSFGTPQGKAEITVSVPRDQATTTQWDGSTSGMNYSVEIPNGTTVYSVYTNFNRDPNDPHPESAGVNVSASGKDVASVECSIKSAQHVNSLEGVKLKPTK